MSKCNFIGRLNENAEKLLQVGIHLMAQKGYEGTSTREIVEAAGVTKPMLYYYFDSKEGLCKVGIRRFSERFIAKLREIVEKEGDPRELLVDYIWTIFKHMQDNHDEGLLYMSLVFGPERQWFVEDIKAVMAHGNELTVRFTERMVQSGVLRPGCEEDFGKALRGMIDVWRWEEIIEGVVLSREITERIVSNLLDGFGGRE